MNKKEFIAKTLKTYNKSDINKRQVTELIEIAFKIMGKTIQKEKRFSFPKFGTFTLKKRKGRIWTNPQTSQTINIDSHSSVSFKPSIALRNSLNHKKISSLIERPEKLIPFKKAPSNSSIENFQLLNDRFIKCK